MNPTQAENLRILIRHMEGQPLVTLRMIVEYNDCGTPACAMGHAKTVARLCIDRRAGLEETAVEKFGLLPGDTFTCKEPSKRWGRLFGASLAVMGGDLTKYLFDPTSQEWAVEARKVLAENGYSMDEPKPAQTFQSFMAKALEPVDTTPSEGVIIDCPGGKFLCKPDPSNPGKYLAVRSLD